MHILFYHQNYPAQFGHIAQRLMHDHGWRVSYASKDGQAQVPGMQRIMYRPIGGATDKTHYCSRTFENYIAHSQGLYQALQAQKDFRPDVIVGHSGFGTTLFLRDLFDCPHITYFEYFYHVKNSDLDFRPEQTHPPLDLMRARARNAGLLLDLHNCDAGYSPTIWQRDRLPKIFHDKVRVVFDGVDMSIWRPGPRLPRQAGKFIIPNGVKLVTYAARGLESIRGFDVFMKFAQILSQKRKDVRFVVVGSDRIHYGGDEKRTGGKSFKQWVLEQDQYDLSKFAFLGPVSQSVLARLFQITDLHVYLTAPFVLSWSLFNALACGALVLASDTAPVRELITHEKTGLLHPFFDPEGMAEQANRVLEYRDRYQPMADAGHHHVQANYSLDVCLPKQMELYQSVVTNSRG